VGTGGGNAFLGSDGVHPHFFVPVRGAPTAAWNNRVLEERQSYTMERVLAEITELLEPEEMAAVFDEKRLRPICGRAASHAGTLQGPRLVPGRLDLIPARSGITTTVTRTPLSLPLLHPVEHSKLMRVSAERGRQHAILRARCDSRGYPSRAILTAKTCAANEGR